PAMKDQLHKHNPNNAQIFDLIQADALQGRGVVLSLTDCNTTPDYGEPLNALKSNILSPFTEAQHVSTVLDSIWKARAEIARTGG
ncbi:MAG: aspartate aminotransferase family protein, partial [Vicinamibacterales bacterium]